MQGEEARCLVPWAGYGPTPHEPRPAPPREDRASEIAAPRAVAPCKGRVPARRVRANQHPNPSAPALNAIGKAGLTGGTRSACRAWGRPPPPTKFPEEPRNPEPERRTRAGRERRSLAEEPGGAQATRTLRADAFAWPVSFAPIEKTDKPVFCNSVILLCTDSVLFHISPTARTQNYPHLSRRHGSW